MLREGAALHWLPFHAQCPPCSPQFKPQSILKYTKIRIFNTTMPIIQMAMAMILKTVMVHSVVAALYFALLSANECNEDQHQLTITIDLRLETWLADTRLLLHSTNLSKWPHSSHPLFSNP